MDIDKYIESIHPSTEKERKKLRKILNGFGVWDKGKGIREIRVPKRCHIPFRGNLYSWNDLMNTVMVETYSKGLNEKGGLVEDEFGLLWLRIHKHCSAYDDDLQVFFPIEDVKDAEFLYDKEGPRIIKYFEDFTGDGLVIPHFRFNDAPYLYLVTNDLTLSKVEMFDQLVSYMV